MSNQKRWANGAAAESNVATQPATSQLFARAVSLHLDGRGDEALVELERALTLDPEAPEARLNRANVLVELGHYEEAAEAFAPLVDDPDAGGAALWGLAAIRDACGDTVGALRARSVAITRIPELTRRCQSAARGAALRA